MNTLLVFWALSLAVYVPASCNSGRLASQCHCSDDAECGTGTCTSGCKQGLPPGQGWSGPACQTGNIALNKPTNQTKTFNGQTSDRAVDGQLGDRDPGLQSERCAHQRAVYSDPATDSDIFLQASFWIDLQATYRIFNITVHGAYLQDSDESDLGDFSVSVQKETGELVTCGTYSGTATSSQAISIECDVTGRYVQLQKIKGALIHQMQICEIVVIGHQYYDCSSCPRGVSCDEYGGCERCPSGKLLPECIQDCMPGTDPDCSDVCLHCKDNTMCTIQDGRCPSGCQMWWTGDRCHTQIDVPDRTDEALWSGTQSLTSLQIQWEPVQDLPPEASSYYFYLVTYRWYKDHTDTDGPVIPHTEQDTLTAVIADLDPGTVYDIRVWPYRQMDGQQDYGEPYDRLMLETLEMDDEDDSSAQVDINEETTDSSSLSWTLFGVSCGIIFILLVVIVFLVLKYVQRPFLEKKPQRKPDFSDAFYANNSHHIAMPDSSGVPDPATYDDVRQYPIDESQPSTSTDYEHTNRQEVVYQNDISPYEHMRI